MGGETGGHRSRCAPRIDLHPHRNKLNHHSFSHYYRYHITSCLSEKRVFREDVCRCACIQKEAAKVAKSSVPIDRPLFSGRKHAGFGETSKASLPFPSILASNHPRIGYSCRPVCWLLRTVMDSTIKLGQFILFKSGSNASNPSSPTFREKRSQKKTFREQY
jgi:hypothetical protein